MNLALVNWTMVGIVILALFLPVLYISFRKPNRLILAIFILDLSIVAGVVYAAISVAGEALKQTRSFSTFWVVLTNPEVLSWWDFMLGSEMWAKAALGSIVMIGLLLFSLTIGAFANVRGFIVAILAFMLLAITPIPNHQIIPVGSYTIYSGNGTPISVYSEESMDGPVAEGVGLLASGTLIQVGVGEVVAPGGIYIRIVQPGLRGYIWYTDDLLIVPK